MSLLKQTTFAERQQAAADAKKAMLAKFKPKPAIADPNFVPREERLAAEREAARAARELAKEEARKVAEAKAEARRLADEEAAEARRLALLNDEGAQLALKREERKERKAEAKAAARAKREAKRMGR
ncbi:MAG: DUF6481 family protein [Caulobacter sp.]|nr:DUF6481 family protein [Caulobacter sp.]